MKKSLSPMLLMVAVIGVTLATAAFAQTKEHPKPKDLQVIEEVPPPPKVQYAPTPEAKVTTTQKGADTVEEYRINGKLYKMRITPAKGPAYFLVDPKGDGNFIRADGPDSKIATPTWVIKEW